MRFCVHVLCITAILIFADSALAQNFRLDSIFSIPLPNNTVYIQNSISTRSNELIFCSLSPIPSKLVTTITKTTQKGELIWQRQFNQFRVSKVFENSDSTLILIGTDYEDFLITKISKNGETLWEQRVGSNYMDNPFDMIETSDKSYLIVGFGLAGSGDFYCNELDNDQSSFLVKISNAGELIWAKCFAHFTNYNGAWHMAESENNIYISVTNRYGYTSIFKVDQNGNQIWYKNLQQSIYEKYYPSDLKIDKNGNILVVGCYSYFYFDHESGEPATSIEDGFITRLDPSNGSIIISKKYGGTKPDCFFFIKFDSNDDIIILGQTNSTDGDIEIVNVLTNIGNIYPPWWILELNEGLEIQNQSFFGENLYSSYHNFNFLINTTLKVAEPTDFINNNLFFPFTKNDYESTSIQIPNSIIQNGFYCAKISKDLCPNNQLVISPVDAISFYDNPKILAKNHITINKEIFDNNPIEFNSGKSISLFPGSLIDGPNVKLEIKTCPE